MESKDILEKIVSRASSLNKISAEKIDKSPAESTLNISQDTKYEIIKNNKMEATIKVKNRVFISPEALFSIKMEHIMNITFNEQVNNEDIDESINKIIQPLGPEVSHMVSLMTREILGSHLILPPGIKVSHMNEN